MDNTTLTAGRDIATGRLFDQHDRATTGRLFDRRVNDLPMAREDYLCYSPFHTRRSGQGDLSPATGIEHSIGTTKPTRCDGSQEAIET